MWTRTRKRAERAKATLELAELGSKRARENYNKGVDEYNGAVQVANAGGPSPGPAPAPFVDPYADEIAEAKRTIKQAQDEHQQAGDRAAAIVRAEAAKAPDKPGWFRQIAETTVDAGQETFRAAGTFLQGAADSIGETVQLARMFSPYEAQTNPAMASTNLANLGAGVVESFKNPYSLAKATVDIEGWRTRPLHTAGGSLPSALMSAATGGGGGIASRVATRVGSTAVRKADVDVPTPPSSTPPKPAQTPFGQPQPSQPANSQPPPASQPPASQPQPASQQPPTTSQPPPSTLYGDLDNSAGPREDGGFGPRGSTPEPAEPPVAQDTAPSQRRMPHDIDDDLSGYSFMDGHTRPPDIDDGPLDSPSQDRTPDSAPPERPDTEPNRPDPEPETSSHDGDGLNADEPDRSRAPGERAQVLEDLNSAAVQVDPDALPRDMIWRESNELLYRMDDRDLFETGATPRNPENLDLEDYTNYDTPSGYVSWSRDPENWLQFADRQYQYLTDAPGGIDVNASVQNHGYRSQEEIAAPGGTATEHIIGRYRMVADPKTGLPVRSEEFEPNPHYRGTQKE